MALHHVAAGEKNPPAIIARSGKRAKTLALVKTDRFEAVQLVLPAGNHIAVHSVPGYATVHCLAGSVVIETEERVQLDAGDWLYLDRGQKHSVFAIADSSLLVTIIFD